MDEISLLGKVARRLHIGKAICKILLPFAGAFLRDGELESEKVLASVSQDIGKSCIRQDMLKIVPKYDLQVVIPAYNAGRYIERCVDSVLCLPTRKNILVTVVNDGSTDDTGERLRKYENEERVEVVSQPNKGFSGARNRGLEALRARYVTFLDSDDELIYGDYIDRLIEYADTNGAYIVECGYVTFNDSGDLETFRHEDKLSEKANGLLYGFPWGKIFKSELFSRVCFPEGYWFEDTVMAFVVYPMCKKAATSGEMLYRYRINPDGITSTSRGKPKSLDTFYVTRQLLKDRSLLGLNNDIAFYDTMLRQVRMNYNRVKKLGSDEVDRAVFAQTADLWRNYFLEFDGQIQSPLAKALCENNFKAYKLILEFT